MTSRLILLIPFRYDLRPSRLCRCSDASNTRCGDVTLWSQAASIDLQNGSTGISESVLTGVSPHVSQFRNRHRH
jgi:hypothetical protein